MTGNSSIQDHPVFICGHPKSGTSLLRSLLDSHPQLVTYPEETVFFRRFLKLAQGKPMVEQVELAEKHLLHIFDWRHENPPESQKGFLDRDYSHISSAQIKETFHALIRDNGVQHPGDILSAAVLAYGQISGQLSAVSRCWVEKSPYNEHYAENIYTWWPQARCIHIVRDPRDNFASYRKKHPGWSAELFASNWRRSTRAGLAAVERYGPERYWLLRYEDLVCFPEENLRQLALFLGIDVDESLFKPTRAGDLWKGNSMFSDRFQQISSAPVGRWKESLEPEDAWVISLMVAPLLKKLNYEITVESQFTGSLQALSRRGIALRARWRVLSYPFRWRVAQLFDRR